jgi:hypothetical protein
MNIIERNNDVIDGHDDFEALYQFDKFPIFMGCTNQPESEDILVDMRWVISKGSGMIQLKNLIPLDVLYPESHGAGSTGELWIQHHRSFANFIGDFSPESVLEIGGSHGILCKEYKRTKSAKWTILEPNPSPVDGVDADFIQGFFDDNFTHDEYLDTVVHSHVFEHVYDPDQFIKHVSAFLKNGHNLIFSIPNMEVMMERKYNNCINFEHTTFLTEPYIEYILSRHGFRMIGKKYFMEDHSIFYAFKKEKYCEKVGMKSNLYAHNKRLFQNYVDHHIRMIESVNDRIGKTPRDRPIYLFGAHVFSQYLISFGLNTDRIIGLLDNDTNKHGKRLYGGGINVYSPKKLKDYKRPVVILKAGVYNDEIKQDIINNINSLVEFI